MIYKLIFTIDLGNMRSIKVLADDLSSLGCTTHLFSCLYDCMSESSLLETTSRLWVAHTLSMLRVRGASGFSRRPE